MNIEKYTEELITLRHYFHQHPELALQEVETSAYIRKYLEKLGYELKEGKFPTGKEKDYTILFGEYGPFSFYNPNGNGEWYDPSIDDPPVDISKDTFTISVGKQDGEENTQEPEKHKATVTGLLVGDWNKGYETVYGAFLSIDQLYALYQEV